MNIEETKSIVEVTYYKVANEYLQLGWVLISRYVTAWGSPEALDQQMNYVLAWQKQNAEPQHPENASIFKRQLQLENLSETLARAKSPTLD